MAIDPGELERRFAELSELPGPQRSEALRGLAATDVELAARLAALFDASEKDEFGLDALGNESLRRLGAFDPADLIDSELGGWRLTGELGRGGMGVVYAAQRARDGIVERAAIKLLAVPVFDTEASRRFVREAAVLARLDHPGICRLRDWGRTDQGWPFLVLDLIEGERIDIAATRLPLMRRIELIAQIAEAVGAAHRQLVVHLDLKPENMLIDRRGRPVLLDFGVSRVLGDEGSATATLTRWLTPDYASPEQLRGEPASVAADIYALGAVLYELVTGRRPFELAKLPITEALRLIEKGAPAPSGVVAGVPGDLDAVIAKAMHVEPTRRYASANAFAEDLRAVLGKRPVSARPDSIGYRLRKLVQRNPVAAPAAALAMLAITALAVLLAIQANDLRAQRDRAEREAARAQSATGLLLESIKAADPSGSNGEAVDLGSLMEATSRRIRLELADEPDLLAEGLIGIGKARSAMGQQALAIRAFDEAIGLLARESASGDTLAAQLGKINALRWMDRFDEAIGHAEELLARTEDAERWQVLAMLGVLQVVTGNLESAERNLHAALPDVVDNDIQARVDVLNSLGSVHSQRGQLATAIEWYDRALSEIERLPGSPDLEAVVRSNRAHVLSNMGRIDEAVSEIDRALEIRRGLYGEQHHLTVETMGFRVSVLTEAGRYDEAAATAEQAIAIEQTLSEAQSHQSGELWGHLGMARLRAQQYPEAIDAFERALQSLLAHLPANHATIGSVRNNLASAFHQTGQYQSALEEFLRVWDVYYALSPAEPTNFQAIIASNLAECHAKLGLVEQGLQWAEKALSMGERTLPEKHWVLGHIKNVYAENLFLDGRIEEADALALAVERLFGESEVPVQPQSISENLSLLARIRESKGDPEGAAAYRERLESLRATKA